MKNLIVKKAILSGVLLAFLSSATDLCAQEREEFGYNIHSLRPIKNTDQLFKKTLWYRIDLREKQNRPFNAKGYELSALLINAVRSGILRPFTDDKLTERMAFEEFMNRITKKKPEPTDDMFPIEEDDWGGEFGGEETQASNEPEYYLPRELFLIELKEDLIFDKKRSRMYRDIQTLTLILPAEYNAVHVDKEIATFLYKEVVENVFKDNPQAIWFNNANPREHRNMAEAFDLRLFSAHLIKYENGDDEYIVDICQGDARKAMYAALQIEYDLLEFENNLWEN